MELYNYIIYFVAYLGLFTMTFYALSLFGHYRKKQPGEKEDKKVTIIIPAYNEAKSIERTIKSALSLDYPKNKLEIIVVDDGSKDDTYKIAKQFVLNGNPRVRVFTKKNGGKGSALNLGIKESKNEIIVTMDADTFVEPDALRKMIGYFYSSKVMAVTPSMGVYNARNIWERVQQIEYYLGIFLRKAFASLNAIHVTPGAFSAYRRDFFVRYGGFEEDNITEDLEIALRIQHHNYIIENSAKAGIYTLAPKTFRGLLIQRRRWYAGLIKNLMRYKDLFNPKRGPLGIMILPLAIFSTIVPVGLTVYGVIKTIGRLRLEFLDLQSVGFKFHSLSELNWFAVSNYFYILFSQPLTIIGIFFFIILILSLYFAKKNMKFKEGLKFSFVVFIILYSILFAFWWMVSYTYLLFNKNVVWRKEYVK